VTRNNQAWSVEFGSGGSSVDGYWVTSNVQYEILNTPEAEAATGMTIVACFSYNTVPNDDTMLLYLSTGGYEVRVLSAGQKVKLVGTTTVTSDDLDISMAEENPVPLVLRLTLDENNVGRLYMREIIEDDDANTHYLEVNANVSSSASQHNLHFGNYAGAGSGEIKWASVYATTDGAFGPDELATSDFATDTLIRMALSVVETLRNSNRLYLKTHMDDSAIRYGYDLTGEMLSRQPAPFINVVLRDVKSPQFSALGGGSVDQTYEVLVYIITRGTNYENAFRMGLNIAGEVFDEVYTTTGLKGTTDSLMEYSLELDHRTNQEDLTCVHLLTFTYDRRINMRKR